METRDHLPHHSFYQLGGQKSVSDAAPAPSLPLSGLSNRRDSTPGSGYQVVKDEIKRILVGVVTLLVSPKWWLYGLFEELGASKAFLNKVKGMSDIQIRTAIVRSQLTRAKRFEILTRDGYACHYGHRTGVPGQVLFRV